MINIAKLNYLIRRCEDVKTAFEVGQSVAPEAFERLIRAYHQFLNEAPLTVLETHPEYQKPMADLLESMKKLEAFTNGLIIKTKEEQVQSKKQYQAKKAYNQEKSQQRRAPWR